MDDTTCRLATGHAAVIHSGLSYPFFVDFSSTSIERRFIKGNDASTPDLSVSQKDKLLLG